MSAHPFFFMRTAAGLALSLSWATATAQSVASVALSPMATPRVHRPATTVAAGMPSTSQATGLPKRLRLPSPSIRRARRSGFLRFR